MHQIFSLIYVLIHNLLVFKIKAENTKKIQVLQEAHTFFLCIFTCDLSI